MKKLICNHYAPHDLIVIDKYTWKVTACCYGAVGQESVIGLVSETFALLARDDEGRPLDTMYVPVRILDALINNGIAKHYGLRNQEITEAIND